VEDIDRMPTSTVQQELCPWKMPEAMHDVSGGCAAMVHQPAGVSHGVARLHHPKTKCLTRAARKALNVCCCLVPAAGFELAT